MINLKKIEEFGIEQESFLGLIQGTFSGVLKI